ncbi:hypothetical protein, partial [Deinococcus sp.]|uniref:hypothetical protein n=1 Tax=Deinococcus sp. TaxID=47478 RepID=UPI002869C837
PGARPGDDLADLIAACGTGILDQPPATFAAQREAAARPDFASRYWAMIESENLGVTASWIGKGEEPPSSYKYDTTARQAYIEGLRIAARIPKPIELTPDDELAVDRAAWRRLRQERRMRA